MKKRFTIIGIVLGVVLASTFYLFKSKEQAYEIYNTDSPSRLQEVYLNVSDLKKLSRFYQEIIGFDILKEEKNRITLTADGSTPLLILEEIPDSVERPIRTTGLYHFAILLPDHASLGTMLVHLSQTEYPLDGAANHQYSDALYFSDPDGNGIEIYVDLPPEKWERTNDGGYVGGSFPLDFDMLIEEAGPSWNGLPINTRIGHMHLQAAELDITEQFYVEGLGFSVTTKGNGALFLSKDNYHHHIALNTWVGTGLPAPPSNSRGLKQFTLIFTQEEIEQAKSQLKRLGFPYEIAEDSIVVLDPSGNTLHIVSN